MIAMLHLAAAPLLAALPAGHATPPFVLQAQAAVGPDRIDDFLAAVLGSTEAVWAALFAAGGADYLPPVLVLYSDATETACGPVHVDEGPSYCAADQRVYLDPAFYRRLETEFGSTGDFAFGYVVAHEVGHHVQHLLGVLPAVLATSPRLTPENANRLSILVELQADCYAGVWGHHLNASGLLDAGDLEEGLALAYQIGDDALQLRLFGRVAPETMRHGSSDLRVGWFRHGFEQGTVGACGNADLDAALSAAAAADAGR